MRFYGKRFAQNIIKKHTRSVQETRDAILWDIQPETHTCRVLIQGSPEFIIAHYPRNWKEIPYWLKRGNAVRILHRGGNRGYVEVTGEGRAIPTPVSGSTLPDPQILPDGFIIGGYMEAFDPPIWGIKMDLGTYRINGDVYFLNIENQGILFDSEDCVLYDVVDSVNKFFLPEEGNAMSFGLEDSPAEGYFRYDAFCVGISGSVIYLKGVEVTSEPAKRVIPVDHILIGDHILIVGGVTEIYPNDIGRIWTDFIPTALVIDINGTGDFSYDMPYVPGQDEVEISISVIKKNQYDQNFSAPSGSTITLTRKTGGGLFYLGDDLWDPNSVTSTGSGFTWKRDQTNNNDNEPLLFTAKADMPGFSSIEAVGMVYPGEEEV